MKIQIIIQAYQFESEWGGSFQLWFMYLLNTFWFIFNPKLWIKTFQFASIGLRRNYHSRKVKLNLEQEMVWKGKCVNFPVHTSLLFASAGEIKADLKMLLSLGMLMLSATQIYTIFTVQIFAFLNLLPVEADISAVSFYSSWNATVSILCCLI